MRDGQWLMVPTEDIVVGDLVEVKGGDKVPADIRLVSVNGLKVGMFYKLPLLVRKHQSLGRSFFFHRRVGAIDAFHRVH
jgi:hypothetical protein